MTESKTQVVLSRHWFGAGSRSTVLLVVVFALTAGTFLSWRFSHRTTRHLNPTKLTQNTEPTNTQRWLYGRGDARFTVLEYADLECPFCRQYFPVLRQWIDLHPQVNWEWRNLPLSVHDPAATREARLAECAGEVGGNGAFWSAVAWIYEHTESNGSGLPADAEIPGTSRELQGCLASARPDAVLHAHVEAAAAEKIDATPTLRLIDHLTGKALTLYGPVEGDALLSAIDFLAVSH